MRRARAIAGVFFLAACLAGDVSWGENGRRYDFEFKQMDFRKVILSLAALEKRSVQFTQSVGPRPIDVSLRAITPNFAIRLLTESYGYVYVLRGNVYHVMTPQERGPAAAPMVVIPLKHVLAQDIEDNVRTFLGGSGTLSVNKAMNALVVSAQEEVIVRLRQVVEQLDQENTQVFIEAKIVETSTTFSRSLGLELGPNVVNRPPVNGVSLRAPGTEDAVRVGFTTGVANASQLQARLTAGERNGEVKIISQPRITTLNGVTANISSQLTFNVRTLAAVGGNAGSGGAGGGAAAVGSIQAVKAGLQLQVTPFIVSNEKVRLTLSVTKSDPDFSAQIDGVPGISDNSANTSLIVGNGQTASIGGLVSNRKSSNTNGFPFLSKLPILGIIFGNLQKESKETELLIFLTPSIYRGSARLDTFVSTGEAVIPDGGPVVGTGTTTPVPGPTPVPQAAPAPQLASPGLALPAVAPNGEPPAPPRLDLPEPENGVLPIPPDANKNDPGALLELLQPIPPAGQ